MIDIEHSAHLLAGCFFWKRYIFVLVVFGIAAMINSMITKGLYEQIISRKLDQELNDANQSFSAHKIDDEEASKVLAQYVGEVVEKALYQLKDEGCSLNDQVKFVNQLVAEISHETADPEYDAMAVAEKAEELLAVMDRKDGIQAIDSKKEMVRPETSVAKSSLFTGAVHEPQMYTELKKEIVSCNRIDMLVSFIKWSGLRLIMNELTEFTKNGGMLRVITTSYMGATDAKAVEELSKLPNTQIRVSYDTERTRLHAKSYIFYRNTGFTTAYVGSSNLSNAAISSGLEWNVKVTKKDLSETVDKIQATFESYWNASEFELYDASQKERLTRALKKEHYQEDNANIYTMDIRPYYFQQEILDKLEAERKIHQHYHNLLVAATGTGKTVISALDYRRFCKENPDKPCRLLFIAHREEILKQSLYTFRAVMKDANFGEMFVGNYKPDSIDYLFMSIQTFNSQDFTDKTNPDFYDFIVVDEFHHAAAPTYQQLLSYYKPKILLGLTATPERMDGKNILEYFDGRIAAEIRLPEAIDRKLLCPFQYFGLTDTSSLSTVRWTAGGYDKAELTHVYTDGKEAYTRADLVVSSLQKYASDINQIKGLGFCVSVEHAKFMNDWFNKVGIPSMCLTGNSPDEERNDAKRRLTSGEVKFIFVVDIYNEGVDIPEVNTVLFLRPTESLTVFLQQLGRGLRIAEDKECLTVLDFIGQANKKYNFESRFAALLCSTASSVTSEIHNGFVNAPKGCYIQLEKIAAKYILDNIKASYGSSLGLVSRIASFKEDTGMDLSLSNFLSYYDIDPRFLYKYGTFTELCIRAGVRKEFDEPLKKELQKSMYRFAKADSRRWIHFIQRMLAGDTDKILSPSEKRMLQMLQFTIWKNPYDECGFTALTDWIEALKESPVMCMELKDLLQFKLDHIDFIDEPVDVGFDCPLDLHCTYTKNQILVAMDYMKPGNIREGVKWLPEHKADVFFVTLNKADKDYSPTTMYSDYSINDTLFHWQSQSTTPEDSKTGKRYINHAADGSSILLFVREYQIDRISGTREAFTYLGKAEYVSHTGSRPMNVIWKLDKPIPAKFMKKTNKLMV